MTPLDLNMDRLLVVKRSKNIGWPTYAAQTDAHSLNFEIEYMYRKPAGKLMTVLSVARYTKWAELTITPYDILLGGDLHA